MLEEEGYSLEWKDPRTMTTGELFIDYLANNKRPPNFLDLAAIRKALGDTYG